MSIRARFLRAFLATAAVGMLLNALPYLRTRGAYQADGQEVAGFPFVFHQVGGDCWPAHCDTFAFHPGYFLANLALVLLVATGAGLLAARRARRRTR